MSGKGEVVKYTRLFEKGPLTSAKKKKLKDEINAVIDAASNSITLEAMVAPGAAAKRGRKKHGG